MLSVPGLFWRGARKPGSSVFLGTLPPSRDPRAPALRAEPQTWGALHPSSGPTPQGCLWLRGSCGVRMVSHLGVA